MDRKDVIEKLVAQRRTELESIDDEMLLGQIARMLNNDEADKAFMDEFTKMAISRNDEPSDVESDDDDRYASEIWEEWSAGGAIVPKNHPLSHEPFHAVHTLLHVLWEFNEKYNAENLLLDWIDENGWAGEFEAFLKAHYEKETHE